ncbi:DUF6252 family protein [Hymenobacter persicinus]|uniref:Uncharacterized protein n=1 Tax=Hymenobacter persicinus TaxID=2025506 RepID=A0A4Q5LH06_9BACT|nr:DUF6252 family protein [Hymenobacter persicinus]RYU83223.1 hypothetical protein EWM57_02755 [Hymenobacter persicinus]
MHYLLRTWTLLLVLGASLLTVTSSCSKKENPAPAPTTGAVEGLISPVGSITTVTATSSGGLTFPVVPNGASGAFALPELAAGTYVLSFTPASGYVAPSPRTVDVVAGKTTAAGTVSVSGNGTPRGTVSWMKDGTAYSSTVLSGLINNQSFSLEAAAANPTFTDNVRLDVPLGITGPGTYSLAGSSDPRSNTADYWRTSGTVTTSYTTQLRLTSPTTGINGTGTLTVSSYDAATRTMSGTFAFNAYNLDNGLNNVVRVDITNGTFTIRF